jgi:hypothetical protein
VPADPWLAIPAAEYEGHLGPEGADQLAPLGRIFAELYGESRPERLAILGCATGNGLEQVDPRITSRVVGVDLHPGYLEVARRRFSGLAGLVSPSPYPGVAALGEVMRLVAPEALEACAARGGLSPCRRWEVPLRHGKRFFVSVLEKGASG